MGSDAGVDAGDEATVWLASEPALAGAGAAECSPARLAQAVSKMARGSVACFTGRVPL